MHSPSCTSAKSFDMQVANWRIESLGRDSDSESEEEEFFDCLGSFIKIQKLLSIKFHSKHLQVMLANHLHLPSGVPWIFYLRMMTHRHPHMLLIKMVM